MKRLALLAFLACIGLWAHQAPAQFNGCQPGFCSLAVASSGPTCSYTPVTTGIEGAAYTGATPSGAGGTTPYTFSETGSLPTGITLNTSNGVLSGTPSVSGSFPSIQIKLTDSASNTVNCGSAFTLVIAPIGCTYTPITTGAQTIAYTGATPTPLGGTPAYTFSETGSLPSGLSISSSTGVISGTPTVNGSFPSIQMIVTDSLSNSANCGSAFTLVIAPTPTTTSFDPGNSGASQVLSNGNLTVTGNGSNGIARTLANHSSGKYYAEFTPGTNLSNSAMGAVSPNLQTNNYLCQDANNSVGAGYGSSWCQASGTTTSPNIATSGHTYGIAIDVDNRAGWIKDITAGGNWNANVSGNPATNTNGAVFTGVTIGSGSVYLAVTVAEVGNVTFNFGATSYVGTPPSGFSNW